MVSANGRARVKVVQEPHGEGASALRSGTRWSQESRILALRNIIRPRLRCPHPLLRTAGPPTASSRAGAANRVIEGDASEASTLACWDRRGKTPPDTLTPACLYAPTRSPIRVATASVANLPATCAICTAGGFRVFTYGFRSWEKLYWGRSGTLPGLLGRREASCSYQSATY